MDIAFIDTKKREDFPEFKEMFGFIESYMGYLPNAYLLMAENSSLIKSFSDLTNAIFLSKNIDAGTKQLIALASSLSSGCKYCQSHTAHGAERSEISLKKISDILNYSKSSHYDDKEKALLDLAFASGTAPNQSKKEHFDKLKEYFSNEQIIDIVSVISLFGFLNRWNDTFGTVIEEVPSNFLEEKLIPVGWQK